MGNFFTNYGYVDVYQFLMSFSKKESWLLLGLDNAGKTSALYTMHLEKPTEYTMPTIGFNIEHIKVGNMSVEAWDLGGQQAQRAQWDHYYEQATAIIYVIDSLDRNRFDESSRELQALMNHRKLRDLPFLILANKQDLPNSAKKNEIIEKFELESKFWAKWHVVECCARKNQRLQIGLEWLKDELY